MHIPDGFLNMPTATACGLLSIAGIGTALRRVDRDLPDRRVPLLGLSAAFVFAAQMLNFPVAAGTSGHLIGATLCAILLGPEAAMISMSAVLILQCLIFGDGGITTLGANLFNMALVAPLVGYGVWRFAARLLGTGTLARTAAIGLAAWCSTMAAALACAGQLATSGVVSWNAVFPAMGGIHALIGIGEALITILVIRAVSRARPDMQFDSPLTIEGESRSLAMYACIASFGLVLFISPFASSWPDGLEKIAGDLGFEHNAAKAPIFPAPIADYALPGIESESGKTIGAGLIGVAATLALFSLIGFSLNRLRAPSQPIPAAESVRESAD